MKNDSISIAVARIWRKGSRKGERIDGPVHVSRKREGRHLAPVERRFLSRYDGTSEQKHGSFGFYYKAGHLLNRVKVSTGRRDKPLVGGCWHSPGKIYHSSKAGTKTRRGGREGLRILRDISNSPGQICRLFVLEAVRRDSAARTRPNPLEPATGKRDPRILTRLCVQIYAQRVCTARVRNFSRLLDV